MRFLFGRVRVGVRVSTIVYLCICGGVSAYLVSCSFVCVSLGSF